MQRTEIGKHLSEESYSCHYIKGKDQLLGVCASMSRLVLTYTMGKQEQNRNISTCLCKANSIY